jgi:DNA-binding NarL/FixJ family response regulator
MMNRRSLCALCAWFALAQGCNNAARTSVSGSAPNIQILSVANASGLNGLDAARTLKILMPSVPIIMFTLYVDPFLKEELRCAGVAEVVSKSEDIAVLTQKARAILYQKAA